MKKCPECGAEVRRQEMTSCPCCGYPLKKKSIMKIISIAIILIVIASAFFVAYEIYEKEKAKQIQQCEESAKRYMAEAEYDLAEECYDKLDQWHIDTQSERILLNYERRIRPEVLAFDASIEKIRDDLKNRNYDSLSSKVNELKEPMDRLEQLEINLDSLYGQYISSMIDNPLYKVIRDDYIDSNNYNLDSGLTSWGYEMIIHDLLEELCNESTMYEEGK